MCTHPQNKKYDSTAGMNTSYGPFSGPIPLSSYPKSYCCPEFGVHDSKISSTFIICIPCVCIYIPLKQNTVFNLKQEVFYSV